MRNESDQIGLANASCAVVPDFLVPVF